jgi:hypothetical protein
VHRKTEGVFVLVQDVLGTFSEPYSKDVTDDVCVAIEGNQEWRIRYTELATGLGNWNVNKYVGRYTKRITGRKNLHQNRNPRSTLIESYMKLVP